MLRQENPDFNGKIMKKKVIVGMSGGVDSSVAALLLKEQGYDVTGVTLHMWDSDSNGACGSESPAEDAKKVAEYLGIPHYVLDFKEEFKKNVIEYFVREYKRGCTPNPCIACNRFIKWEALLHRALFLGAQYIATGHYGNISYDNGRYAITRSASAYKDQSYVLYMLTQEELGSTLFPLSSYEKSEIREIAMKKGLPVATKKESQDICFIPDHDYAGFIEHYTGIKSEPGNFVDTSGRILGRHRGIIHYTLGQRKGLGIALGRPAFVVAIRPEQNEVVLGEETDLMTSQVLVSDINYMAIPELSGSLEVYGKLRYSQRAVPCTITAVENGMIRANFETSMRAPTPGQAAVFYTGDRVACGGKIV